MKRHEKLEKTEAIFKKIKPWQRGSGPLVVSELLEQLMAVWGGPQQFAAAFHTEFGRANAGSMTRARMLGDIFRLFHAHTAAQKGPATTVEGMTDAELRATLHSLLDEDEHAPDVPP
jgi:hypothetical protein